MSNDGQNFENPVNPSDDTQPQTAMSPAGEVAGAQSRRKFLRTAVISGVAVATVTTSAGVAAAAAQPHTGVLKRLGITNPFGSSGPATCTNCFTSTSFAQVEDNTFTYNHTSGSTNPGDFYLWFTWHNVSPGTYTITVTPDPGTHDATVPFKYTGSNSCKLFQVAAGTATDCPSGLPNGGTASQQSDTITTLGSYTFSGSSADLQLAIHCGFDGKLVTGNHDYTFTAALMDGDTTVCSTSITLHAQQSQ